MTTDNQIVLRRLRRRKILKTVAGYAVILTFLGSIAYVTGNPFGMAFFVVSFIALRYCYKDKITFHCESAVACVAVTCGMFAAIGFVLIPVHLGISILAPVLLGLGITWLAHWLGKTVILRDENNLLTVNNLERDIEIEKLKERIAELEKANDLYQMMDGELNAHGKKKGLNKIELNIAYQEFYEKVPKTEIGERVGYSRSHIYRLRRKMYSKLGLDIDETGKGIKTA